MEKKLIIQKNVYEKNNICSANIMSYKIINSSQISSRFPKCIVYKYVF